MKTLIELYNIIESRPSDKKIRIHIDKINDPIIPDAIDILSNNKRSTKVTNKSKFDKILKQETYFSSSYSTTFQSPEDYKNRIVDEDSVILKDLGDLVAVWDDKNSVGYIIPVDKLYI